MSNVLGKTLDTCSCSMSCHKRLGLAHLKRRPPARDHQPDQNEVSTIVFRSDLARILLPLSCLVQDFGHLDSDSGNDNSRPKGHSGKTLAESCLSAYSRNTYTRATARCLLRWATVRGQAS